MDDNLVSPLRTDPEIQPWLDQAQSIHLEVEATHSWTDLHEILSRCALGELVRAPAMLAHYKACGPPIKAKYGSMADFIRWKLDFQQASTSLKVSLNDFPYSIPRDGQHYVVWALQPHTDASLAASSEEWQGVLQKGVSGFTGCLEYESDGFAGQPGHAGARIRAFIAGHWPTSKGWQTMFFMNPFSLQTIPDLPHFHVFARRRSTANH